MPLPIFIKTITGQLHFMHFYKEKVAALLFLTMMTVVNHSTNRVVRLHLIHEIIKLPGKGPFQMYFTQSRNQLCCVPKKP